MNKISEKIRLAIWSHDACAKWANKRFFCFSLCNPFQSHLISIKITLADSFNLFGIFVVAFSSLACLLAYHIEHVAWIASHGVDIAHVLSWNVRLIQFWISPQFLVINNLYAWQQHFITPNTSTTYMCVCVCVCALCNGYDVIEFSLKLDSMSWN